MASLIRRIVSSKLNVFLIFLFSSLLLTFAFVLGFVIIPEFDDTYTTSASAAQYAVIKENFPDPTIFWNYLDNTYYAFGTRNDPVNVQVASASNISSWTLNSSHDALPNPGSWAATHLNDTQVWAPSVTSSYSGQFIMYYSALAQNQTRKHCIGAATSLTVTGPYTPFEEPIVCDFEYGGVIDPAYFHDPGTNTSYLIYKRDGNAMGKGGVCSNGNWPNTPTPIYAVELSVDDLITPVGESFELLANLQEDGPNIESPMVYYYEYRTDAGLDVKDADLTSRIKVAGSDALDEKEVEQGVLRSYHLLFNSGCFHDRSYQINHIICIPGTSYNTSGIRSCDWSAARTGPGASSGFAQMLVNSSTPINVGESTISVASPGGPAIDTSNQGGVGDGNINKQYMAFHADTNLKWYDNTKGETRVRSMFIAELEYWGQESMVKVKGLVRPT